MPRIQSLFFVAILFSSVPAHADLAHNHAATQNEASRIEAELNATKNIQGALDKLQVLIKREPSNVEAHMLLGKILQLLGYERLADEEYQKVDELDPTKPTSILNLFQTKLMSQGGKAAYEYLRYVQRRFPHEPSVYLMEGMLERMQGDNAKAEFLYNLALERNPTTPGIYTAISAVRLSEGKYKEAIELADHDLKLKADHPAANLAKAQALIGLGKFDKAIRCLLIAYAGVNDKRGVADVLSRALISNGQYSEAFEPTLVCLSMVPMTEKKVVDQLKTRLLIIVNKVGGNELMNSLEIAKRYVVHEQVMASLYFASGDVLEKANFPREAEKCFRIGIGLYPYSGRPFLRLGKLQERLGDYQAAMRSYDRAYQLSPEDREVAARLLRLIRRAPIQQSDIAWLIKDLLKGGRKSQLFGSDTPVPKGE